MSSAEDLASEAEDPTSDEDASTGPYCVLPLSSSFDEDASTGPYLYCTVLVLGTWYLGYVPSVLVLADIFPLHFLLFDTTTPQVSYVCTLVVYTGMISCIIHHHPRWYHDALMCLMRLRLMRFSTHTTFFYFYSLPYPYSYSTPYCTPLPLLYELLLKIAACTPVPCAAVSSLPCLSRPVA